MNMRAGTLRVRKQQKLSSLAKGTHTHAS